MVEEIYVSKSDVQCAVHVLYTTNNNFTTLQPAWPYEI